VELVQVDGLAGLTLPVTVIAARAEENGPAKKRTRAKSAQSLKRANGVEGVKGVNESRRIAASWRETEKNAGSEKVRRFAQFITPPSELQYFLMENCKIGKDGGECGVFWHERGEIAADSDGKQKQRGASCVLWDR